MKKASVTATCITTIFYICCGGFGYAAFGNSAPGNLLTGFGFYEPYWLIDFANLYSQPVFAIVERWAAEKYPNSGFAVFSNYLCCFNNQCGNYLPVLQPSPWSGGNLDCLAVGYIFPRGNVYYAEKCRKVDKKMDCSSRLQYYLLASDNVRLDRISWRTYKCKIQLRYYSMWLK
ncbi:hypothetical protein CsSME_00016918 [Camellia sinensis var. sinensis]